MSQKRIISASRRTDIPAFYSKWLMNRVRAGFCHYPNPLYPKRHYQVDLRPESVLGFVFWTRNAKPLLKQLQELDKMGYAYYFQYTINNYPRELDPKSPPLKQASETFRELAGRIGKDRIIWRYDPVVLSEKMDADWHKRNFTRVLSEVGNHTSRLVISVLDPYLKTRRGMRLMGNDVVYEPQEYTEILRYISKEAILQGIDVQSCAEPALEIEGIEPGRCIDAELLAAISGTTITRKVKEHKQREGCKCHESVDIGVNNTCGFGCKYCYAISSHEKALEAIRSHHPAWTCMTGDYEIEEAKMDHKDNSQGNLFQD